MVTSDGHISDRTEFEAATKVDQVKTVAVRIGDVDLVAIPPSKIADETLEGFRVAGTGCPGVLEVFGGDCQWECGSAHFVFWLVRASLPPTQPIYTFPVYPQEEIHFFRVGCKSPHVVARTNRMSDAESERRNQQPGNTAFTLCSCSVFLKKV